MGDFHEFRHCIFWNLICVWRLDVWAVEECFRLQSRFIKWLHQNADWRDELQENWHLLISVRGNPGAEIIGEPFVTLGLDVAVFLPSTSCWPYFIEKMALVSTATKGLTRATLFHSTRFT